jgi:hypothetical protein
MGLFAASICVVRRIESAAALTELLTAVPRWVADDGADMVSGEGAATGSTPPVLGDGLDKGHESRAQYVSHDVS